MTELQQLFHTLKQPEYVHVLLNPLPVYGTAIGILGLVIAWILRSRPAQIVALILVAIGCGSVWPVMEYGEHAYDRVYSMSNKDAQQWLDVHAARATKLAPVFYTVVALAVITIIVPWKFPKSKHPLMALTLLAALCALASGAWISHAGGQVRHSEFREGPPPVTVAPFTNEDED
jgi:hypothetical protein